MEGSTKKQKMERKFKIGDRVYAKFAGFGTVVKDESDYTDTYPIHVKWDALETDVFRSVYTIQGKFIEGELDADYDISLVSSEESKNAFAVGDRVVGLGDRKGTVLRMRTEYGTVVVDFDDEGESEVYPGELEKINYSAVNPAHYQVAGIPEAIEIMEGLMTKEQLEGFLWGNILKYAYRYGRKGDKKETAGKIKWYAEKLEEVENE